MILSPSSVVCPTSPANRKTNRLKTEEYFSHGDTFIVNYYLSWRRGTTAALPHVGFLCLSALFFCCCQAKALIIIIIIMNIVNWKDEWFDWLLMYLLWSSELCRLNRRRRSICWTRLNRWNRHESSGIRACRTMHRSSCSSPCRLPRGLLDEMRPGCLTRDGTAEGRQAFRARRPASICRVAYRSWSNDGRSLRVGRFNGGGSFGVLRRGGSFGCSVMTNRNTGRYGILRIEWNFSLIRVALIDLVVLHALVIIIHVNRKILVLFVGWRWHFVPSLFFPILKQNHESL